MKKSIYHLTPFIIGVLSFIAILFASMTIKSQVNDSCRRPSCLKFQNTDLLQIYSQDINNTRSIIAAVKQYSVDPNIKKSLDTVNQNLRQSIKILDSINELNHVLQYTLSATSTNTGTAYTVGYMIAGASNATVAIPNGEYIVENIVYAWGNTVNRSDVITFSAFDGSVTAMADNTAPNYSVLDVMDKYLFTGYVIGLVSGYGIQTLFGIGVLNMRAANSTVSNINTVPIKITQGYITFLMYAGATTAPAANPKYNWIIRLRKYR